MSWPVPDAELGKLGKAIVKEAKGVITGANVAYGELNLTAPAAKIVEALTYLRDVQGFQQLVDLCGVDYPERPLRFDVVYHLLSMTKNRRVRISVQTDEDTAVPSVVGVFAAADWFEREAFDMYGVFFDGHPLRKDFPMTGYVEVRYDEELKRVVYEPVKSVEWRNWDFLSPWEGAEKGFAALLPGDEKSRGEKSKS